VNNAPRWTRSIVGVLGLTAVAFGASCFVAAPALFGADAYRTLARVPIGLLGATSTGLGSAALLASIKDDARALRSVVVAMFVAAVFVPPVVSFNIGAFDRIDTSGARTLSLVITFVAVVATPLLACLLTLNRLIKSGEAT
jgi:MFS family permease